MAAVGADSDRGLCRGGSSESEIRILWRLAGLPCRATPLLLLIVFPMVTFLLIPTGFDWGRQPDSL